MAIEAPEIVGRIAKPPLNSAAPSIAYTQT